MLCDNVNNEQNLNKNILPISVSNFFWNVTCFCKQHKIYQVEYEEAVTQIPGNYTFGKRRLIRQIRKRKRNEAS
jgi:hypothetical protein